MAEMTTSRKKLVKGVRRGAANEQLLMNAYATVFERKSEAVDLVLADLAEYSGYYATMPRDATALQYARAEGGREVFARILSLSGVSDERREEVRVAALAELRTSLEEGN